MTPTTNSMLFSLFSSSTLSERVVFYGNSTAKNLDELEQLARVDEPTAKWRRATG